jgi:signal transduction histidine kinase/ActR/RegA family two-component response regulator
LGIDHVLFGSRVGRVVIAPSTCFNFVLLGVALLTIEVETRRGRRPAQWLALIAATSALTSVGGYLYGMSSTLVSGGPHVAMAAHTAVNFMLLSFAVLGSRPEAGVMRAINSDGPGGVMARRMLPTFVLLSVLLAWLRLWGESAGLYSAEAGIIAYMVADVLLFVVLVVRNAELLTKMDEHRRRVEEQLLRAKRAADAASEAKSAFVANISHEIRTPLTGILGFADLCLDPSMSDRDRLEHIKTIRRNGEHLLTVINDVLDLAKVEAGKVQVESLVGSPMQIVRDVIEMVRPSAEAKYLKLDVQMKAPVPRMIRTDPMRLRQSLLNLVGNAIKFTQEGGVTVIVSMATPTYAADPILQIDVIDTGVGINEEQQKQLFKAFLQSDATTTPKLGGTGLGLSIAKEMAKLLGGDLTVRSSPGKGSIFTFSLRTGPLIGVALEGSTEATNQPPLPPTQAVSAKPETLAVRVLVAEDGLDNRQLIRIRLRMAGATVQVASDGAAACVAALDALEHKQPFDLILMDMQMPIMDGCEATLQLRNRGYDKPIIALTANADSTSRQKCMRAGCNAFLTKPIDPAELIATVRRWTAQPTTAATQAA